MIYSNIIKPKFNTEAIDRDFDIFRISIAKKDDEKEKRLPKIVQKRCFELKLPIRSVSYVWGKNQCVFIMVDKNSVTQEKALELQNSEIELFVTKHFTEYFQDPNSSWKERILLQMLLNLLPSMYGTKQYSNLEGELLLCHPKWVYDDGKKRNPLYVLKISVEKNNCLQLTATTFQLASDKFQNTKYENYVWDQETNALKREQIPGGDHYIRKAIEGKRAHIPYVNWNSLVDFEGSKLGFLCKLTKDINILLKDYVAIELLSLDEPKTLEVDLKKEIEEKMERNYFLPRYLEFLSGKQVYLIDKIKNDESKKFIADFKAFLKSNEQLKIIKFKEANEPLSGTNCMNIILIHNLEHYQDENVSQEDQYVVAEKGQVVQNMTLEDFGPSFSLAPVMKIFQELIVKADIQNNCFSDLTKKKYFIDNPMIFYKLGKLENKQYLFQMQIDQQGHFEFEKFEIGKFGEGTPADKMYKLMETAYPNNKKYEKPLPNTFIDGGVFKDDDNYLMIKETNMFTIPDYLEIEKVVKASQIDQTINLEHLLEAIEECREVVKKKSDAERLENFSKAIQDFEGKLKISDMKEFGNLRSDIFKSLNKFYYERSMNYLWCPIRNKDFRSLYGNHYSINFVTKIGQLSGNFYYVGTKESTDTSKGFARTTRIREVIKNSNDKKNWKFSQLFELLEVEFVNNANYTVLPFPFKYLKEYIQLEDRKEKQQNQNK